MLTHKKVFRRTMIILLTAFALLIVIGLPYIAMQEQVAAEIGLYDTLPIYADIQEEQSSLRIELQDQQTQHITKQVKDRAVNFLSTTSNTNAAYDKNDVYDINDEYDTMSSMTVDKIIAAYENPEPQPINWDNARKYFLTGYLIITIIFSLTSIIISISTLIRRKYYEHKKKSENYNKDRSRE